MNIEYLSFINANTKLLQNNSLESKKTDLSILLKKTNLYTIPKNTFLYHGILDSNINNVNMKEQVNYYSPNKQFAIDYIINSNTSGHIYKFKLKKDITNIMIISIFEKKIDWTLSFITENICSSQKLNGIGFFFPRKIENTNVDSNNQIILDAKFAFCSPDEYLERVSIENINVLNK